MSCETCAAALHRISGWMSLTRLEDTHPLENDVEAEGEILVENADMHACLSSWI